MRSRDARPFELAPVVVAETAADAVTETAIAGSSDIALDLVGDMATVEPFSSALEAGDCGEDMLVGLSGGGPDGSTFPS
jgi:hypothetical protein